MTKKKIITKTTVTEEIVDVKETTQIICILDTSGSMAKDGLIYEAINGFNKFIEEQKDLPDNATLTVALFDNEYELLYDNVNIKEVKPITDKEWYPRGMTALYDAIGKTINTIKGKHNKLNESERPDKVLVCIVTDGLENCSKEYANEAVKSLIKDCEKNNWNFIYLAANQNAFSVGTSLGFSGGNTFTYANTSDGVGVSYSNISDAATKYRSMNSTSDEFSDTSKNLLADEEEDEK